MTLRVERRGGCVGGMWDSNAEVTTDGHRVTNVTLGIEPNVPLAYAP